MGRGTRRIQDYDRILVVEGYSDLLFFAAVLESMELKDQVFIKEVNGKAGLREKIETFMTPDLLSSKVAIGFVVDADGEPHATARSLRETLFRITGQAVTDCGWTAGTPRIGMLVVPGGDREGEMETLVWESWSRDPANASQRECIQAFTECMRRNGVCARSAHKGLIGSLLAVRNDEGPRLGPGARGGVFDLDRETFRPLRLFLDGFR